jgi:hypothetical protein
VRNHLANNRLTLAFDRWGSQYEILGVDSKVQEGDSAVKGFFCLSCAQRPRGVPASRAGKGSDHAVGSRAVGSRKEKHLTPFRHEVEAPKEGRISGPRSTETVQRHLGAERAALDHQ